MTTPAQHRRFEATADFLESVGLRAVAAKTHGDVIRLIEAIADFQDTDDYDNEFEPEIRRIRSLLVRIRNLLFAAATPE